MTDSTSEASPPPDLTNQYEIIRELGRGAFATVYLARERVLHRLVAIKVLKLDLATSDVERARFVREARAVAHLDHPGIVPLLGFGETPSTMYIVMRYIGGESLAARLERERTIEADEARRLMIEIATALAYAHRQGIVHRDLKPENVLLTSDGASASTAKLLDFGVAAFRTRDFGMGAAQETWGTPTFMSPEQALGESDLDGRSDLYSLGIIGYAMLAGRLPFLGANPMERLRHQQKGPAAALGKIVPNAPAGLVSAIERCLAYDPADRWARASDLLEALLASGSDREAGSARETARRLMATPTVRRARRRNRRAAFFSSRPSARAIGEAFSDDIRYSARSMLRSIGFTIAAVLTFAIGIGANATMFGVIDRVLLQPPKYVVDPGRVVRLRGREKTKTSGGQGQFNYPLYKAVRDHSSAFERVAMTADVTVPFGLGAGAQDLSGMLVSASYFPLLGVTMERGRAFTVDEDAEPIGAPVVVISDEFWRRQFAADPRILERSIDLGARKYAVVGVAPPGFTGDGSSVPDVWLPVTSATGMQFTGPKWATNAGGATWLRVIARLRNGVTAEAAGDATTRMLRAGRVDMSSDSNSIMSVDDLAKERRGDAGARITLLLGGMSFLVLLIACANVANLLLARGLRRRREIAIRLALGVSRTRLVTQLITESTALAVVGGAAALIVAYWGGQLMRRLLFSEMTWADSPVDFRVFAFTAAVAITTGVLAGLIPALATSRADLTDVLKSGAREGGGHRSRPRSMLLVAQAMLSLLLLAGAGLFAKSLNNANRLRLGVDIDRVVLGRMKLDAAGRSSAEIESVYRQMLERVRALPGVASAAIGTTTPFSSSNGSGMIVPGQEERSKREGFFVVVVTPDYFKTLGARIIAGRDFAPTDRAASPIVFIISEAMATMFWPNESAIGKCVRPDSATAPCIPIVGVAENIKRQNITESDRSFVYAALGQIPDAGTDLRLIVRPADGVKPSSIVPAVQLAMQTAAPDLPHARVGILRNESGVGGQIRPWEIGATLLGVFATLAVVLAAVGLYGVISYTVAQRTHEMGLRIALGANPRAVAALVIGGGLRVTVAGVALGAVVGLSVARFVEPLLFHVSPRDPVVYGAVAAVLVLVAIIASAVPAWRATRVDPVVALRAE